MTQGEAAHRVLAKGLRDKSAWLTGDMRTT